MKVSILMNSCCSLCGSKVSGPAITSSSNPGEPKVICMTCAYQLASYKPPAAKA